MVSNTRRYLVSLTLTSHAVLAMKKQQSPLRSQRHHRGFPLNCDLLCWVGAIALVLLFFGVDQHFAASHSGPPAIEQQRVIPQHVYPPEVQALPAVKPSRP